MSKEMEDFNKAVAAMAKSMTAAADAMSGVAHARTAANTESQIAGRTTKDADRSETVSGSAWRRDSDTNVEEGQAGQNLSNAGKDRAWFDAVFADSRRHANESAERTAVMMQEGNKFFTGIGAQVQDAQKKGTDNLWTMGNETEAYIAGVAAKVFANMAVQNSPAIQE